MSRAVVPGRVEPDVRSRADIVGCQRDQDRLLDPLPVVRYDAKARQRSLDIEEGYWLKFEIKPVTATGTRPHGLSYSFTLHGPDGTRLVGFDNAHEVRRAITGIAPRMMRTGLINSWMPIPCFRTSFTRSGGC